MSLKGIRSQIDIVDEQIVALLNDRFQLVLQAGKYKSILRDAAREKAILAHIHSSYIRKIYREIFRSSRRMLLRHGRFIHK